MNSAYNTWHHPYKLNPDYSKRVAYFSMEFATHQPLKTYSGGLGFLSGSHMRSAFDLKQNVIGIGMLWKYGYYDQGRNDDRTMRVQWMKKYYTFLEDTGIIVPVYVNNHQVLVKALVLRPEVFGTVPIYLLTTDIEENDHLAKTITEKLYDANHETRVVQNIILGIGGAKVVDALGGADVYHMNEGHALPLAFHLYTKYGKLSEVQKRLVFTTHTPEKAGNEEHDINLLDRMGFFSDLPIDVARKITHMHGNVLSYTPAALSLSRIANGVSQLHGEVSREMWDDVPDRCEIIAITNSQNAKYWKDKELYEAMESGNDEALMQRKRMMKRLLIEEVADQTGKIFDENVLTIVWARRFAAYKRADLIMRDIPRFLQLINGIGHSGNEKPAVQIIWAGKPYPLDHGATSTWNHIQQFTYKKNNIAVLADYELRLSKLLKMGADVWLNTPRRPREASGTSGMTACMNGAINFSIDDGWIPEFAKHGENCFLIPAADPSLPLNKIDELDHGNMMDILEKQCIPTYYKDPEKWVQLVRRSMGDVLPYFDSDRMAGEYYNRMYNA